MANLKGGTFEKQVKDAFHRLEAFGKGRHGNNDHLTHSDGLASKREMYLNDYKEFAEQNGFTNKLNETMNNENISIFLNQRLEGLKHSTQNNYIRGLNSMLKGLQESNITISCESAFLDSKVEAIRTMATADTRTGLAIVNLSHKIEQLYEKRFETGVLSEVMENLGIRISESYELVKNIDTYYNSSNGSIENLVGKGNHIYIKKTISSELFEKIKACNCDAFPSQNTLRNDLKEVGINNPHLIKFSFTKNEFEKRINEGMEYHQALREVSKELNHSRESMSLFYLSKS